MNITFWIKLDFGWLKASIGTRTCNASFTLQGWLNRTLFVIHDTATRVFVHGYFLQFSFRFQKSSFIFSHNLHIIQSERALYFLKSYVIIQFVSQQPNLDLSFYSCLKFGCYTKHCSCFVLLSLWGILGSRAVFQLSFLRKGSWKPSEAGVTNLAGSGLVRVVTGVSQMGYLIIWIIKFLLCLCRTLKESPSS